MLASGYDLQRLVAAQSEPSQAEIAVTVTDEIATAWYGAFVAGGTDVQKIGHELGKIAKAHPKPVPVAQRREVVKASLVTTEWPAALRVTALDADTGALHVLDQDWGSR